MSRVKAAASKMGSVVAGSIVCLDTRGVPLDLVVDVVNAIGAPVLWYGCRDNVEAVTVFH